MVVETFKFRCPACGQKYRATIDSVGKARTCAQCGEHIQVPTPEDGIPETRRVHRGDGTGATGKPSPPPASGHEDPGASEPGASGVPGWVGVSVAILVVALSAVVVIPLIGGVLAAGSRSPADPSPSTGPIAAAPAAPTPALPAADEPAAASESVIEPPPPPRTTRASEPPPPPAPEPVVAAVPPPPPIDPVVSSSDAVPFDRSWFKPWAAAPYLPETAKPTRFHKYNQAHFKPADAANVEAATLLGGPGFEWLCGGGFQTDGTIVVVGTCFGPELTVAGQVPAVLGSEGPAPTPPAAKTNKKGQTLLPDYTSAPGATFIVRLATDMQSVIDAARLPWGSGTATDALVDEQGAIWVTGLAGPDTSALAGHADATAPGDEGGRPAFVARLAPDAATVLWSRTLGDAGQGPRLRPGADGRVRVVAGWTYIFEGDGSTARVVPTHKVKNWLRAVNPVDFSCALGYDRNTHTGREPWRQPHLEVIEYTGDADKPYRKRHDLYVWNPKLVGTDQYRLVSDSSFKALHFADDGTLLAAGWSDGGNTVFNREPRDLDTKVTHPGLGFSAWGAGVLSLCHLLQLDPTTGEVLNKTVWCGYLSGKESPSSAQVRHLGLAGDGSLLLAGRSAAGLIQTGNHLHQGMTGGPYVAVLAPGLDAIRFATSLPPCGQVELRADESITSVSGIVGNRHKVLFLSGAVAEKGAYTDPVPPPVHRPVQADFGGGLVDGHLVLLDLGPVE